jgi:soluble lytic murein transglycosylase-like protein
MTSAIRAVVAVFMVLACGAASPALAAKAKVKRKPDPVVVVTPKPDPGFLARDAFYSGEIERAYPMAVEAGERWVAGLAAYRLQNYSDAFSRFQSVAEDAAEDSWTRAGAAYWAARAAVAAGLDSLERPYLQMAADRPWTFYGMIAERQLGLAPTVSFAQPVVAPDVRLAEAGDVLAQLIRVASTETAVSGQMAPIADIDGFRPADYPSPDLAPLGGFTIDPALVYALVRQESRFNPLAISSAGAVGLMQMLPSSAAFLAGDDKLNDRTVLQDGALNLRLGQDYLTYLSQGIVGDNMLLVIAAYNGGPGAVQKTYERVGRDADPLMLIESLPAKETREYVEKVMAGYWIYRRQFGEDTPSLDALASGAAQRISLAYDRLNSGANIQTASAQPAKGVRVETTAATIASLF